MPRKINPDTIHEIVRLYRQGYGADRIAMFLGMDVSAVKRILVGRSVTARRLGYGVISRGRRPRRELVGWCGVEGYRTEKRGEK